MKALERIFSLIFCGVSAMLNIVLVVLGIISIAKAGESGWTGLEVAGAIVQLVMHGAIIALAVIGILKAVKKETLITGMRYYFVMIPMLIVLGVIIESAFHYFSYLQVGDMNVIDAVRCMIMLWFGLAILVVGTLSILLKVKSKVRKIMSLVVAGASVAYMVTNIAFLAAMNLSYTNYTPFIILFAFDIVCMIMFKMFEEQPKAVEEK